MEFIYYLIPPETVRILHCYTSLILHEIPESLEELICRGTLDVMRYFRLPKNLMVFEVDYITDSTIYVMLML